MQFAILVSTIIAVLLGSFLTLTYTRQFFRIQSNLLLSTIEKTNEGIYFSLHPKNSFTDSISIDADNVHTSIKKEHWGGFEMLVSSSTAKTKSFTKKGLTGTIVSKPNTSIYVSDSQLPLVLVGDTQIEGTAYISAKGIKPGTIAGHYYTGKELVKGKINIASGLPELEDKWIKNIEILLNFIPSNRDMVIEQQEMSTNSFFEKTNYIYERGPLRINEAFIGNIIIKSDTEIIISARAKLTDVVVIAPKITIKGGFRGNASFIANERIHLEKNVTLTYPSALVLLDDTTEQTPPTPSGEYPIFISGGTTVSGIIVYLSAEDNPEGGRGHSEPNIAIEPNATLEGMIYCRGNVELSGTVIGSVYTKRFVAKEFGSVYVNHIYNGKVLGNDIQPNFCGLPLKQTKKGVVKWLY